MTLCGASFAVSSPERGLMSKMAILQPPSARRSVKPRPMPCPPPVTTATFPNSPFTADLLCVVCRGAVPPMKAALKPQIGCRSSSRGCPVLVQRKSALRIHLPRDDRLHDLDRAAGDLDHPCIGIGAGDRIFPHIAPA